MSGNYDQGYIQIKVGDRVLKDVVDAEEPEVQNSEPTRIMAGGGRGVGFNKRSLANGMDYEFTVQHPSEDAEFLWKLSQASSDTSFSYTYTDDSELPDGTLTELHAPALKAVVMRGANSLGDEAGAVAYTVKFNGYRAVFKGDGDDLIVE